MSVSLERVRAIVGVEQDCGIGDAAIREALWEYYFDIDQTVDWVFGAQTFSRPLSTLLIFATEEQARQHEARERQGEPPSIPFFHSVLDFFTIQPWGLGAERRCIGIRLDHASSATASVLTKHVRRWRAISSCTF